jgi:hypothetical protein
VEITLNSWLQHGWRRRFPSLVQAGPRIARFKVGSSAIVLITFCCRVSITLTTLLLIQPCSTCRGISSKLETRCVT